MKNQNTLKLGDWNSLCDLCGFKFKSSDLRDSGDLGKRGLKVCKKCYDPVHPQDLLRGKVDDQSVPWSRPDTSDEGAQSQTGDVSLVAGTDKTVQDWGTDSTAATVTLSETGTDRDFFILYKSGGSGSLTINSNVTTIATVPTGFEQRVYVRFNGSTWYVESITNLGL